MTVTKAPQRIREFEAESVFLAGSIEMGAAEDWQTATAERLVVEGFHVVSPRRDDWDSTWVQSIADPRFREQVEWELDYLDSCHRILLYLSPGTKSPISLLELGLYAKSDKLIVACPDGFWRKGNVEIVCARYGVPLYEKLERAIEGVIAARLDALLAPACGGQKGDPDGGTE